MVGVGVVVNLLGIIVAVVCGWLFALSSSTTAGILSGSLTSAPTYAAVSEICPDSTALSVAFALTYPFGLVGLVLLVQTLPGLVRQDLAPDAESDRVEGRRGPSPSPRPRYSKKGPGRLRVFHVTEEDAIGRPLRELELNRRTGCLILLIHRGGQILFPRAHTVLETGDHLLARGRVDELQLLEKELGREVFDSELLEQVPAPRQIRVLLTSAVGKSLRELNLTASRECLVTEIERSGEIIEAGAEVVLQRHDIVEVLGQRRAVRRIAEAIGRLEPSAQETDIAVYAGGILLGLLLGSLRVDLFGLHLTLGAAGGLLLAGLLLGRKSRFGRLSAYVPPPARQLVRDLGILLFVSETGVGAGARMAEALGSGLLETLAAGVLVALIPVLGALLTGRFILRLRPIDSWGSVAGGMTSAAALAAVKRAADSDEPAIAYATAYAVACVLVTMSGHIVVALMG
jgi:putative transport protein